MSEFFSAKNKNLLIAIAVALATVILISVPFIITLLNRDDDNGGGGDGLPTISDGVYVLNLEGAGGGSSKYTFSGNEVVREYYDHGYLITDSFTYEIIEVEGNSEVKHAIVLTDKNTNEVSEHSFYKGVRGSDNAEFISINESWYFKQSDSQGD